MTQKEYDEKMNAYRKAEYEERIHIEAELSELFQQRRYLGQQTAMLNAQLGVVRVRIAELVAQRKAVGRKYYELKKDLIRESPRQNQGV